MVARPLQAANFSHPADLDPAVVDFVARFYQISDIVNGNDEYISCFAPEGCVTVFGTKHDGLPAIHTWRAKSWQAMSSRVHTPLAVYQLSPDEIAVRGRGVLTFKDGNKNDSEFMGFMKLARDRSEVKLQEYEIKGMQ